jgi:hypothetical protein
VHHRLPAYPLANGQAEQAARLPWMRNTLLFGSYVGAKGLIALVADWIGCQIIL